MSPDSGSEKSTMKIATVGLFLGLLGMVCGYGFSVLFPQIEVALYDWHVEAKSPVSIHPSIVVITLEDQDPASCKNGRWNSSTLATTISALNKAGASVIAPAIRVEVPNPPECGDILGHAQLLEATKQAGNVVYPSFVQPMIANEARLTGWFSLSADHDGIFRRLSGKEMAHDPKHWPFGLAIASASNSGNSFELPEQGLISFAGQWADQPFSTYTFSEMFDLLQGRQEKRFSVLVHDKIVLLYPITNHSKSLGTPLESSAPLGFLHANILNTALTHSWLKKPSWTLWVLGTIGLVIFIILLNVWRSDIAGWFAVGLAILAFFVLNHLSFLTTGIVWPYLTSAFAIVGTLVGIAGWPLYEKRKQLHDHIENTGSQLTAIQETLARKELAVEQLEEELLEAKDHAQETAVKFDSILKTEDETRSRLHDAEEEAQGARQQLQHLQDELSRVQKTLPALSQDTSPSSDPDLQTLQQKAASFGIRTCSLSLLKTFQELKKTAGTNNPILIFGETGTGKELFAEAAHRLSQRAQGPFVSINMAAIRPELFESELFGHVKGAFTGAISRRGFLETADRGSVFLDEIGELPLDLQAKLLRVLESGEFYRVGQSSPTHVDVRIIAATNRDLSQAVKDGHYREDLYYRLRSLVFTLPPLRERGEKDLILLVQHILFDLSPNGTTPVQCTRGALEAIQTYAWPGNVRELRQSLAQAVALIEGDVLTEHDLRLPSNEKDRTHSVSIASNIEPSNPGGKEEIARREDAFVLSTLQKHGFDMKATAKALEWDRSTVTQRLKGLGFQALVDQDGDVHRAAATLAGDSSLTKIVELKLSEYYRNLLSSTEAYNSAEEAIEASRKRLRNIPERHFPAIETLIHRYFSNSNR